MMKNKFLV